MRKFLKIISIGILSIVLLLGAFALYVGVTEIPYYETKKVTAHVESTPESIKRGEKLSMMLCASCHLNSATRKLTGKQMLDAPPEFGKIFSQNITQDKIYGIGNWSDGELIYLLRTGIKKNGQYSPPYMAKLPNMADEDIHAIISYLRSDNAMVKSDATPDTPSSPSILTKFLCRVAFKPFPMPDEKIEMPDTNNKVLLGKYLAHNLDCFSCHSADFKTNDYMNPALSKGYFAGGNKPLDMQGRIMNTPNITPDKTTGIGNWTKEKFISAVKYGIVDSKISLQYPMIPYANLTDLEAEAIFEYLKTIPAIKNKVQRSIYE